MLKLLVSSSSFKGRQEAVQQRHEPLRGADRLRHDFPVDADPELVGGGLQVPEAGRAVEGRSPGRRPQVMQRADQQQCIREI